MTDAYSRRLTVEFAILSWNKKGSKAFCCWRESWGNEDGIPRILHQCSTISNRNESMHDKFWKFTNDYRVHRQIKEKNKLIAELRNHFCQENYSKFTADEAAESLTVLARELKENEITSGCAFSLLTKIASFGWPNRFIAKDKFATSGLKVFRRLRDEYEEDSRFNFLRGPVDKIQPYWKQAEIVKDMIGDTVCQAYKNIKTDKPCFEAFGNRIVDLYLMSLGGRYDHFCKKTYQRDGKYTKVSIFHASHPCQLAS